jgi:hypothetical protein
MKSNSKSDSDMKPMSPIINGILKTVCAVETPFRKINRIAGVSCVAEGTFSR